jgi:hypothetical protein
VLLIFEYLYRVLLLVAAGPDESNRFLLAGCRLDE